MKKIIILTTIVIAPMLAVAQSFMGFKAGANFSNYSITDEFSNDWNANLTPGFQVAASYAIEFGGMFGVQLEASYSRRGSAYRSKVDQSYVIGIDDSNPNNQFIRFATGEVTFKEQISYLDIPLLFRYNMRGRAIRPFFAAGPQLGFALSANRNDQLVDGTISTHQFFPAQNQYAIDPVAVEEDFHTFDNARMEIGNGRNDEVRGTDFGILIGGGLEIEMDYGSILIEARYYLGMSNTTNSLDPTLATRNRSLIINLGYVIPLGGY